MNRKARRKNFKGSASKLNSLLIDAERALLDGAYEKARKQFERALKSQPENVSAWANLGAACLQLEDASAAKNAFLKALELDPSSVPIFVNLATVLTQTGAFDEASIYYRKALELAPDDAETWHDFARTKRFEADDPDLSLLNKLAANNALDSENRMHAHYALGKALEDVGDYDAAFENLTKANQARRSTVNFDLSAAQRLASKIITTFDQRFFAERMGAGTSDATPILILGMPRSGTTLVEQILSSHSDVYGGGERDDLQIAIADMIPEFPNGADHKDAGEYTALGNAYVSRLNKIKGDAQHVTDKMPRNFYFVGVVGAALPNAKIIHCRRSPIDTCLSCFALHFPYGQEFSYDLEELGQYYQMYRGLMDHWHRVLPGRILDLDYEAVVADTESQARRLLEFCGLPWQDQCLDFQSNRRQVATASAAQVREPAHQRSVERWRRFEKHLAPLLNALGPYGKI